jgi:hypothetical protein
MAGAMAGGAVLALAACGASAGPAAPRASTPTAAQIKAALKSATSVHVDLVSGTDPTSENMGMFANGNMSGTITQGSVALTVIVLNKADYILVTPAFLKLVAGPDAACDGRCGKYLQVTGAQAASLVKDQNMNLFLAGLSDSLKGEKQIGTTTINGKKAIVLLYSDGTILYVPASGTPYPLKLSRVLGNGSVATVLLSEWNSVPAVLAPPIRDVFSLPAQ